MATTSTAWQPKWWNDEHLSAWGKIKEAMKRDWEQTKHDMGMSGGHELNQNAKDTVKQAAGAQPIPPPDEANPSKVIGTWDDDTEHAMSYGYGARRQYGKEYPDWNDGIEQKLRTEWESGKDKAANAWDRVKNHVKYGYSYRSRDLG